MQGTRVETAQEDLKDWTTVHSPAKSIADDQNAAQAADRPVSTAPAAKRDGAVAVPAAAAPSSAAERLKARLASRRGPAPQAQPAPAGGSAASAGAPTGTGAGRRAATEVPAPQGKLREEAVSAPTPGVPQPAPAAAAPRGNPREALLQSKPAVSEVASKVAQDWAPAAAAGRANASSARAAEPPLAAQPAVRCAVQVEAAATAAGPATGPGLAAGEAAATPAAGLEIQPAEDLGAAGQPATAKAAASASSEPGNQPAQPAAAREARPQAAWGWSTFVQGAMRDVQQLRETLLQGNDEEDEEEEERASTSGGLAAGPHRHGDEISAGAQAQRAAVLARLQGRDRPMEAGIKAIEGGMAGLVGTLWSGARAAAREARELAAALELEKAGRRAASLLDSGIETFGETAISLLDGRFDARVRSLARTRGAPEPGADFQTSFLHYGGRQVLEELEVLGSSCAHAVTLLRARLAPERQAALDGAAAALSPAFDLQAGGPMPGTADELPEGRGHALIASICSAGVERAADMASAAAAAGEEVAAEGRRRLAELAAVAVERLLALGRSLDAQFRTGRPADDGICWPVAADDKAKLLRGQALRALAALEALGSAFAAAVAARTSEAAHAAARGGAGDHGHCAQRQPDAHAAAGGGRGPERGAGQAAAPEARPAASAAAGRGGPDVQAQLLLSDAVRAAAGHLGDALRGLLYVVLLASQDWALVYGQS